MRSVRRRLPWIGGLGFLGLVVVVAGVALTAGKPPPRIVVEPASQDLGEVPQEPLELSYTVRNGRQGDKETRGQGDKVTRRPVSPSPGLPLSWSPYLPISPSPGLPISPSPPLLVSLSPCLPIRGVRADRAIVMVCYFF